MLDVQIRHRLGSFTLEASLVAPEGGVTVLVGESGAGKSTLLRIVAGLADPDEGRIVLDHAVLFDRASKTSVPPESRPVGYVAQDYALFPHLSARGNVAFGLAASGRSRGEARGRAEQALERFGLLAAAGLKPRELSGGQQQRVALARALVLEPALLLLDEPLAALDPVTRREARGELRRTLESLPCATLLVTHEPTEALLFGEQIAALESGRITQCGPRQEFARQPRSRYVAEFLGVNLFEGTVTARDAEGLARVAVDGGQLSVPDPGRAGPVRLLVHPHDIVLSLEAPAGSAVNVLAGHIEELIPEPPAGERVRVILASRPTLAVQITRHSVESLGLRPGVPVFASFKATGVVVLPP